MGIPTRFNPLGINKSGIYGPTKGLIFYAPLEESAQTAKTGQTLTEFNSPQFQTIDGIKCVYVGRGINTWITASNDSNTLPYGKSPRTFSYWAYLPRGNYSNWSMFGYGTTSFNCMSTIAWNGFTQYGANYMWTEKERNKWFHFIVVYEGSSTEKMYAYVNSVKDSHEKTWQASSSSDSINTSQNTILYIGKGGNGDGMSGPTYIAGLRIYDRVLTQSEINVLSKEFLFKITAQDLNCSFYQKNETFGITYSSSMTPTFEIIEGTLPSSITFNTSNGQFTGKGLTDSDHTYNLKVRITAENSIPAECNVVIHTYKTARISITNKTFSFYTDGSANDSFSYTSDEAVTFALYNGSALPTGITINGNTFYSDGSTPVGTYTAQIIGTSENNQVGVIGVMTFVIAANEITILTQSLSFYANRGSSTKELIYSTNHHSITPVYSMNGTLPDGVTFNSATGEFTSDATQTSEASGAVQVTISSSTGYSTSNTKSINIIIKLTGHDPIVEDGLTFYMPCDGNRNAEIGQTVPLVSGNEPVYSKVNGISCMSLDGTQNFGDSNTPEYISRGGSRNFTPIFTYSLWFKGNSASSANASLGTIGKGYSMGTHGACHLYYDNGTVHQVMDGHWENTVTTDANNWHHFALVAYYYYTNNSKIDTYVDGVKIAGQGRSSDRYSLNNDNVFSFPNSYDNDKVLQGDKSLTCNMAGLRIYNRVLSEYEINQLKNEFTPTP